MKAANEGPTPDRIALSASQVGSLLGISDRQVWRLSAAKEMPGPKRLGGVARWDKSELETWWKDRPTG